MGARRHALAIEIDDAYLKVVALKDGDQNEVAATLVADIANLIDEDIAAKIRAFAKDHGIRSTDAVSVIPASFAITKNIEIPSVDRKEIHDIIDLQAGRHTPYSRNEIILDHAEIGVSYGRYTKILLVILKKDVVTRRYDIIKKAGFRAETAALSSEVVSRLCAARFTAGRAKEVPVIVVHIDHAAADFTVAQNGRSLYIRSIPVGAALLIEKADDAKKTFLDELKKSLDSYQAENIEALPGTLYVTGAPGAIALLLPADIKQTTGIDVECISYDQALKMPQGSSAVAAVDRTVSILAAAAAPVVLGSITLNLIPEEIKIRRELRKKARRITEMGILFMALLVLFCAILLTNIFFKNLYYQKLIANFAGQEEEAEKLRLVSERTAIVKRFLHKKGESLFVLVELYRALPKEIFLNTVNLRSDGTISLNGTADTMSRVFTLATDLEKNTLFKSVKIEFTKSRVVKGKEVADFGLSMAVEGEG